jgi:nicotinamidase-related amidase
MARVWDPFLTAQDRAYDAQNPTFSSKQAPGARPALLLIDLYRAAFGDRPEPLLEAVRRDRSNLGLAGWRALPSIERLLGVARETGIPVIHVTRLVSLSEWGELGQADRQPSPEVLAERERQYSIMPPLAPVAGELVLRKRSASVFASTPLPAALNQLGVDTLVIAGESTSGCVRAAVVDGRDLRYSIVVPEECVFDRTEASHAINLYDMHRKYAHVLPLEETIAYLRAVRHRLEDGVPAGAGYVSTVRMQSVVPFTGAPPTMPGSVGKPRHDPT